MKKLIVLGFLLSCLMSESSYALLGINYSLDDICFNTCIYTFKNCVLSNPKMLTLIIAGLFYKEILWYLKDTATYFMGEYPHVAVISLLSSLVYYLYTQESHQQGKLQTKIVPKEKLVMSPNVTKALTVKT